MLIPLRPQQYRLCHSDITPLPHCAKNFCLAHPPEALLNIMDVEHFHTKLNFSPIAKETEKRDLPALAAYKYKCSDWGHDSTTPHAQVSGGVSKEPVSAKVA
jgi:hypothetical protein